MTETDQLRTYRRDLHQIPELDYDLPQTLAYLRRELARLGSACTVLEPCESTLVAVFDRGTPHATALRTDMDALPVVERTGVPFASRHPGRMHACGHDGHMAMALGICRWMAGHLDELPRTVMVVFQPAEETTGGAHRVCQSGIFERFGVDRIFGFHLWPDLPAGTIASRPGPLLAASNEVDVRFVGKGAHIARWQEGRDALRAAAAFVGETYRRIDEMGAREPVLVRFGQMEAGTVRNAIASEATVRGSLRTFDERDRDAARGTLLSAAQAAADACGCTADVRLSDGYPPVVNDAPLFGLVRAALAGTPSPIQALPEPLLIAEDFAWYQRYLPGVFLLLGTGTGISLHADTFDFDESILQVGLDAYKRLVTTA